MSESEEDPETGLTRRSRGASFEKAVGDYLSEELPRRTAERDWVVERKALISDFEQYAHLSTLQRIIHEDETRMLATEIGGDYLIKPDVTVGFTTSEGHKFLHASVSCKWTIRSDRVQNIRHEAVILTRHRRGRQPHIVAVTAEPLPTRLAAIARGTGEVDAVYHIVLDELAEAVEAVVGNASKRQRSRLQIQSDTLAELRSQGRLRSFADLTDVLTI